MPGSNSSIAGCNIVLNTVIADEIEKFANILEAADDFDTTLHALIKDTIKNHKRIIFNGNGYDDSWVKEAESRGLLNLKTTPDALPDTSKPMKTLPYLKDKKFYLKKKWNQDMKF